MNDKDKSFFIKLILAIVVFIIFLIVFGLMAQLMKNKRAINPPSTSQIIKNIEISSDKKAILNAETKEVIFTVSEAKKYLHEAGYEYNPDVFLNNTNQTTNAKYGGDCFSDASFKVSGYDRIVFSTACLSGDIQQSWVGIYNFPYKSKTDLEQVPRIYFLAGDNGKNFVWSEEGLYISYDVYSDADEPMKTKEIDIYGKIIYEKIIDNKYFGNEYIQVKIPQKNMAIKSPVSISGKANVFEGNMRVRIKDKNENVLVDTFITASGAYDKLYPFEKEISYNSPISQDGIIEIFAEDMKSGGEINKIVIPVIFEDYVDVSDWKTYSSEEYGFEIKYPNDWVYEQNVFLSKPNLVFCPQSLTEVKSERAICKWKKGATKSQYEDGMIYLFNYASDSKPNNSDYRYLGVGNSRYYYLYSSESSNELIVKQIFSTFKFTN